MTFISDIVMLLRWARNGWDVHPGIEAEEFSGWI